MLGQDGPAASTSRHGTPATRAGAGWPRCFTVPARTAGTEPLGAGCDHLAVWRQDRRHLDHQDGPQPWWVDASVVGSTSASPPAELLNQFNRGAWHFRKIILYLGS